MITVADAAIVITTAIFRSITRADGIKPGCLAGPRRNDFFLDMDTLERDRSCGRHGCLYRIVSRATAAAAQQLTQASTAPMSLPAGWPLPGLTRSFTAASTRTGTIEMSCNDTAGFVMRCRVHLQRATFHAVFCGTHSLASTRCQGLCLHRAAVAPHRFAVVDFF